MISRLAARLLVWFGFDLLCLCGHAKSIHDFDQWTPDGCCQFGSYASGCNCMVYEPKANRPVDRDRHAMTPEQLQAYWDLGTEINDRQSKVL